MTPEEIAHWKALSGAGDIIDETGKPEDPGQSIFETPGRDHVERAFVGRDDDGAFIPLALVNGEMAQLGTKVLSDPSGDYVFATILSTQATARTVNARAVQAVRRFLALVASGQARAGMEL